MGSRTTANTEPPFIGTPFLRSSQIRFQGRIIDRNGQGSVPYLLFRAGEDGSLVEYVDAIPLQNYESNQVLRLFAGELGALRLISEMTCPASSFTNEEVAPRNPFFLFETISPPPIGPAGNYRLRLNEGLWIGAGSLILGAGYQVIAMGGDL